MSSGGSAAAVVLHRFSPATPKPRRRWRRSRWSPTGNAGDNQCSTATSGGPMTRRWIREASRFALLASLAAIAVACSSSNGKDLDAALPDTATTGGQSGAIGTGGATGGTGSGGATSSGNVTGTGGRTGAGGTMGAGGVTGTGGRTGAGGNTGAGGVTSAGGRTGSGGVTGMGGSTGTGGAAGIDAGGTSTCIGASLLSSLGKDTVLIGGSMVDATAAKAPFDGRYLYLSGGLFDGTAPCASWRPQWRARSCPPLPRPPAPAHAAAPPPRHSIAPFARPCASSTRRAARVGSER